MKRHVASDVPRFLVFGGLQIGRCSASPSNQTSNPIAMLSLTNLNSFSIWLALVAAVRIVAFHCFIGASKHFVVIVHYFFKDVSILAVIVAAVVSYCFKALFVVIVTAVASYCLLSPAACA